MKALRALAFLAAIALGGCATDAGHHGDYRVNSHSPEPRVEISHVKARVQPYGLVVTGQVHIAKNIVTPIPLTVDITATAPDGKGAGKYTCAYYPIPKPNKKKAQHAHFTVVMSAVPTPGSTIEVTLTPPAVPDQPVVVNPI